MKLIGLIGFAGSGKTSIANHIPGVHIAFARELKYRAAAALGIDWWTLEERKQELRPLLVELGKAGRLIDPMTWVNIVMAQINPDEWVGPGEPTYIIDDCRYLNECEAILARGGHVFYITRPGVVAANDEERDSIAEIHAYYFELKMIHNTTTPADAAAAIVAAVGGDGK